MNNTVSVHQGAFGWTQEEVFDKFLMDVRGFETRIVACHIHLTATTRSDFPETCEDRRAGDSSAEMPGLKVEAAIRVVLSRAHAVIKALVLQVQ